MEVISHATFSKLLMQELISSLGNWYGSDNWDVDRFGARKDSIGDWLIKQLRRYRRVLPGRPVVIPGIDIHRWLHALSELDEHIDGLSWLYEHLQDEYSKSLLVKVIAYRIMGFRKIKLPRAKERNTEAEKQLAYSLLKSSDVMVTDAQRWKLGHYDLHKIGYPIECFLAGPSTFTLKQYEYVHRQPPVSASLGDIVIDGGGCWGDTALYFSHRIGDQGNVFSFEFVPENLTVFQRNMALNARLAQNIQIVPLALFDISGATMKYISHGPSTTPIQEPSDQSQAYQIVSTITIDDFVKKEGLERVDFIKMDIEGSELNALQGAEQTLRMFKPKLAICLYHSLHDFTRIPKYIDRLELGYQFFLDHFSIHREETVLFADPGK
jgi:FkbM family methyltransferase